MGRIAKVLEFVRTIRGGAKVSDTKVDTGGGAIQTADHFSAPGDDAFPLATDYAAIQDVAGTGRGAAVGYADPINAPKALVGEKRIYARDSNGVLIVDIWLKADGSIKAANANGNFELRADGTFESNGVTISASGDMDVPNSLKVGGKELNGHDHGAGTFANGAGAVVGISGANN